MNINDSVNKTLYEVKPTSQKCSRLNSAKLQFAKKWCDENNWNFIFIEDDWFVENVKLIDYSQHPNLKKSMKQFIWE
jgi:hypothetical protein